LSKDELAALKVLRGRQDLVFMSADKGGATVVLDTDDYTAKASAILEDGPYERVKSDPGKRFRSKLVGILNPLFEGKVISKSLYTKLCPATFDAPYFFGLPKLHKEGVPLRPVIGMCGSLFAPLSHYLVSVLSPYTEIGDSYVEKSSDVLNRLKDVQDLEHLRFASLN
jgi:hypothetical protein